MYIGFRVKCRCSCQFSMKLEFSRQIFEKYSNIKFHELLPVGDELFHADGWAGGPTDKRHDANSRFLQFCELA